MNFLAHYVLATRCLAPSEPLPAYVVGTALPDLLPLASSRTRLRASSVEATPTPTPEDDALRAGVLTHLATDAAFHKTAAFADAQAEAKTLLSKTPFTNIRVRGFFVAHVLVELALDAALLRADPTIPNGFYTAFSAADTSQVAGWTEAVGGQPLSDLPPVLTRFARSRYLYSYSEDEGVAEGLSRVCGRARQDTFEGENFSRLIGVVGETVRALAGRAAGMLAETAAGMKESPLPPILGESE